MKEEHRQKLIEASREAAAAFLEDLHHLRQFAEQVTHTNQELRRISGVVRRLLVDNDLIPVAGPRLEIFEFDAIDVKPIVKASNKTPFRFFCAAKVIFPGVELAGLQVVEGPRSHRPSAEFNPERIVKLRLDGFMNQPAICFGGDWLTRRNALKFAANIASGVHSRHPRDAGEELALRIYRGVKITVGANGIGVIFNKPALLNPELPPFVYDPLALNPILVELLSTIRCIVSSSDTARLERMIEIELGIAPPA
jgi:hypothetical protein